MRTISRRQFLSRSTSGIAAAGYLSTAAMELGADPLGLPVGFQSYSVRQQLSKDFEGILKQLAGVGYRTVELCSPHGYEKSGYGFLLKMKPSEIRDTIHSTGLGCDSSHYGIAELREHLDERIAYAKELGLKQMILAHPGLRATSTMDDWRRVADELNKWGEQTHKAGLQLGYHNHNIEFSKIDGVLVYDEFMRRLDPKLVKMQFQTAVISLGFEPEEFLTKYPRRFISLHVQDWSTADKQMVPVGKGVLDWKKIFAAAKKGGIKNYYVEMSLDLLTASYPYLHDLKV
jgi:sugar phosphate isomerase/epimerase